MSLVLLKDSFKGFTEKPLISARLREFFNTRTDFEVLDDIESIIREAYRGDIVFQKILFILADPLEREKCLGVERCVYLSDIAREFEYQRAVWIFTEDAKAPSLVEDEAPSFPEIEELSLGHRKYHARQQNRKLLERLTYDKNPEVIRELLTNSLITEREVLRIASRRNISPEVLKEIYRHEKWFSRYSVKTSLLWNPHTPVCLSIAIIPTIMLQDLKPVLHQSGFHPYVKDAVRFYMEVRGEDI